MGSEIRLADLAERIGARLEGDGDLSVTGVAAIEDAEPGDVTFLANPKYAASAKTSRASAIIARDPVQGSRAAFLLTEDPYRAFALAVEAFFPAPRFAPGVSEKAAVDPTARLGRDVTVSAFCAIGKNASVGDRTVLFPGVCVGEDASVGPDCLLYPNVVLYHGVRVGARVILHAGCVIGSDGFGFAPTPEGLLKIRQVGTVEIEDDVEVGANTAVDRAALGVTRIRRGTKLDNLVQVGHNVVVGEDTAIAAQVGIAGSVKIGSRVMIGGQAGLAGHLEVEDGILLGAKCGVASSLRASESRAWSGVPAIPHGTWLRLAGLLPKLPDLFRRVKRIEEGNKPRGEE